MKTYRFAYITRSGIKNYINIDAPNKITAWDLFMRITNDFDDKVINADVIKVIL